MYLNEVEFYRIPHFVEILKDYQKISGKSLCQKYLFYIPAWTPRPVWGEGGLEVSRDERTDRGVR
jgi:hypothetical protein